MKRILSATLAVTSLVLRGLVRERKVDRPTSVIFVSLLIVAAAEATGETLNVEVTPGHTVGPPSHAFEVCVLVSGTEYGGVNVSLDWDDDYFADEVAFNVGPTTGDVHYCFQNLAGPYETDSDYFVAVSRNGSGTNPNPIYQVFDVTILPIVIAEVHDAIDASCTGWSIVSESSSFGCDSGVIAGSYSGSSNRQAFASFSGGNLPSNMAADVCQKAVIDEEAAGHLTNTRPGFLFGGSIDDAAEGAVLVYLDDAFEDGKLTAETKYWTGSAVQASVSDVKCVSDEKISMTPGDVLVACVDGTWGSGAEVHAWKFPPTESPQLTDPCPGAGECQGADLGTPNAVLTESDCGGSVPGVTDGTAAGFYGLVKDDASLVFDGDYAVWETEAPPAFTSLAVSPSALYPQMMVGETAPDPQTLSIGNDGNFGEIGGTLTVSGTPEDCQPTTGGNTTWLSPEDGSWTGVTPLADTSEEIDFSGAANCEHGAYEAALDVDCTGTFDCDDDPQTVSVGLTVLSTGGGAGVLGTDFPLGTYTFDWQAEHDSVLYEDQQGWDGTEHGVTPDADFTADKVALVADVSTVSVGLIGGAQPSTLSTTPDDGDCPALAGDVNVLGSEDVANLPTVDLTGGGTGVPVVSNCDFRSLEDSFTISSTLTNGIAFVNSRLGQIASGDNVPVYIYDSLMEGWDDNDNESLGSWTLNNTGDAGTYVGWTEMVGGSDVLKLGNNYHLAWVHLHGYRNTCNPANYPDPDDCDPHFDTIQCQGSCVGSSLIAINSEGPFRTSQQPARLKFAGGTVGDLLIAYSIFSGGRSWGGNGPMTIGDSGGNWDSSGSGDAAVCNSKWLGADDSRGISWCRGPIIGFQDPVPDGAAHSSGHVATDGSTSGTSGMDNATPCDGLKDNDWDMTASAVTGTVRVCEQAHFDAAADRLATHDTWRAEIRSAAGLAAP